MRLKVAEGLPHQVADGGCPSVPDRICDGRMVVAPTQEHGHVFSGLSFFVLSLTSHFSPFVSSLLLSDAGGAQNI